MTDRNRREDLLKVADQLVGGSYHAGKHHLQVGVNLERTLLSFWPDRSEWTPERISYVRALFADLPAFLKAEWAARMDITCVSCGKPVERERFCYVSPTCYACLPPPTPLEVFGDD